jgi:hypothetical protein
MKQKTNFFSYFKYLCCRRAGVGVRGRRRVPDAGAAEPLVQPERDAVLRGGRRGGGARGALAAAGRGRVRELRTAVDARVARLAPAAAARPVLVRVRVRGVRRRLAALRRHRRARRPTALRRLRRRRRRRRPPADRRHLPRLRTQDQRARLARRRRRHRAQDAGTIHIFWQKFHLFTLFTPKISLFSFWRIFTMKF